jgi:two-component system nitrogen regulation sensor histidine kinase GlnL
LPGKHSVKQRYRLALELHVIDNGPGVPDSIKDRIFYPLVSGGKADRAGAIGCWCLPHGRVRKQSGRTDFKLLMLPDSLESAWRDEQV